MKSLPGILATGAIAVWLLLVGYNTSILISLSRFQSIATTGQLPFIAVPVAGLMASLWLGFFSRRVLSPAATAILALLLLGVGLFFLIVVMGSRGG